MTTTLITTMTVGIIVLVSVLLCGGIAYFLGKYLAMKREFLLLKKEMIMKSVKNETPNDIQVVSITSNPLLKIPSPKVLEIENEIDRVNNVLDLNEETSSNLNSKEKRELRKKYQSLIGALVTELTLIPNITENHDESRESRKTDDAPQQKRSSGTEETQTSFW